MNEKLLVNASIARLISGECEDWTEEARVIISFGDRLPRRNSFSATIKRKVTSSGDSITGHSSEYGDVNVRTPEKTEMKEREFGINKERIGYYRLWKEGAGLLKFHHFWKSDDVTQGQNDDDPDLYWLGYDRNNAKPLYLAVERHVVLIRIRLASFKLVKYHLESVYGGVSPRMYPKDLGVIVGYD